MFWAFKNVSQFSIYVLQLSDYYKQKHLMKRTFLFLENLELRVSIGWSWPLGGKVLKDGWCVHQRRNWWDLKVCWSKYFINFFILVAFKSLVRWFTSISGLGEPLQKFFTTGSMKMCLAHWFIMPAGLGDPWKNFLLVVCRSLAPWFTVPAILRAPLENFK